MSIKTNWLVTGVFVLISAGFFCTAAFAESNLIYRTEVSVEAGVTDRLSARITGKFRFHDKAVHYYTSTDIELNYEFLQWLTAGIAYRHLYTLESGQWYDEDRPQFQGQIKWSRADWKLKNRVRLEYRMKQGEDGYLRFRNMLALKSPWKWSRLKINPYLADEVFIDRQNGLHKNRVYAGAVHKLSGHVSLNIYYILETDKGDGDWNQHLHAAGAKLAVKY